MNIFIFLKYLRMKIQNHADSLTSTPLLFWISISYFCYLLITLHSSTYFSYWSQMYLQDQGKRRNENFHKLTPKLLPIGLPLSAHNSAIPHFTTEKLYSLLLRVTFQLGYQISPPLPMQEYHSRSSLLILQYYISFYFYYIIFLSKNVI